MDPRSEPGDHGRGGSERPDHVHDRDEDNARVDDRAVADDGVDGFAIQGPGLGETGGAAGFAEDADLQEDDLERLAARRQPGADVEALLREASDLVEQAQPRHFSNAVKLDRERLAQILGEAIQRLPEELRGARWMLKEREEFLARTNREADEILAAARGQAERMVQRSEVLRSAETKARRIVERARADAARVRNECDDYCDQRLAQLEAALERTMRVVAAGRRKLRPSVGRPHGGGQSDARSGESKGSGEPANGYSDQRSGPSMFDQDHA
jgi:hypothetical protein